ncbi:GNAT family acetyltransferase [Bifidobacterium tissieri]|uniref:GNAT family acetyltransferase n=1 Tax=Bifidobacterium tissieri TaxID=1630162 RepID=A0A261FFQ9_9BIFI|nr:GNAT family acetyltransferase [Bifidobacterium tissieri]
MPRYGTGPSPCFPAPVYTIAVQLLNETYSTTYSHGRTIVIRDAVDDDLSDITRIYNMAVVVGGSTADLTPRNLDQRREWVYSHNPRNQYPVVVIEVDGKVAGFASLSKYHARAGYSDITEFSYYVDKAYARQGLGTMLVDWLVKAATRIGFRIAVCVVFADNVGSTALMHKFGFERYGYLPAACCNGTRLLDVAYWYRNLDTHADDNAADSTEDTTDGN